MWYDIILLTVQNIQTFFCYFFVICFFFFVHRKLEVFRKYSMHCSYICSLTKLFFVEIQLYEPFVWFFTSTLSLNTLIQSTIFWLVVVLSVLFFLHVICTESQSTIRWTYQYENLWFMDWYCVCLTNLT